MATIYEISRKRLVCFLILMVIIFVDIWVSFGATWVVGIQGEQRMQNNQKVLFLDSKTQKKVMSSSLFVKNCAHRIKFSCGLKIFEPNEPIKSEIYTYFIQKLL